MLRNAHPPPTIFTQSQCFLFLNVPPCAKSPPVALQFIAFVADLQSGSSFALGLFSCRANPILSCCSEYVRGHIPLYLFQGNTGG